MEPRSDLLVNGSQLFGEFLGPGLDQLDVHGMKQGPVFRLGSEQPLLFILS